jgi:hypothetical protein
MPIDNADRIPKLDQDPRIHLLADWIIAVTEVAGSYGTNYHPINGWLDVRILTTEIQWRSSHNKEVRPCVLQALIDDLSSLSSPDVEQLSSQTKPL